MCSSHDRPNLANIPNWYLTQDPDIPKRYFFCGVGGSGMLPLALILKNWGYQITGSDRARDQGRTPQKFQWIAKQGIALTPQDGSGLTRDTDMLVVSAAIESNIPEVACAKDFGIPIITRAQLLAQIFNRAEQSIAVAGTSGKSTTTGMIAWILSEAGRHPTVMNGASLLNFSRGPDDFTSCLSGDQNLFVAECDESDGSIVNYHPFIAVLNNIALDHQPLGTLIPLFARYLGQSQHCVLNLSNSLIAEHVADSYRGRSVTFGWDMNQADFNIIHYRGADKSGDFAAQADVEFPGNDEVHTISLRLIIPGRHNIENAVAAMAACSVLGVAPVTAAQALSAYRGVGRRMQLVGCACDITVIDDFAHNPDKIAATLSTLQEQPGRLLIIFQMHGYGPLKLMRSELLEVFARYLRPADGVWAADRLYMPEVLYMGGTTDKSYSARDFIEELRMNFNDPAQSPASRSCVQWFQNREDIIPALLQDAKPHDRIVIMGARDDSLTLFAHEILNLIAKNGLERSTDES